MTAVGIATAAILGGLAGVILGAYATFYYWHWKDKESYHRFWKPSGSTFKRLFHPETCLWCKGGE